MGLPFSQEALQDALSLIQEKLSFYKTQPLKGDWFCVLIDGYRAKLRTEDGKLKEITLFVAVGVDLEGIKEILLSFRHDLRQETLVDKGKGKGHVPRPYGHPP